MEQKRAENPLGYKKISELFASFALPSVIAMLVSSLYNVVDQIFIGRGVGYLANGATNVAFPLTTICMAITLMIGIGTASRFSLYLGRKEEEKAAAAVGNGICMMIVFGLCYVIIVQTFLKPMLWAFGATDNNFDYALSYTRITVFGMPLLIVMNGLSNLARADGSPLYSMTSMMIGAVINTILDPVFIFVFHWGIAGAAWATVIGQLFSCINAVMYLRRLKRIKLERRHIKLSFKEIKKTAVMGMSNGLTQVALTLVQIVMNLSLVHYGKLSEYGADIPLSGSGIVMKVNSIILAVVIGFNQAMQPIVGFNYGAKKYDRVRSTYKLVIASELVITILGLLVFQIFPRQVLSLFGKGDGGNDIELYYKFSVSFMRTYLLFLPLSGIQMISSNFFAAIGKPVKGAFLSLTRQVFFLIPLLIIMPFFMGIKGILYSAPAADLLAFITVMIFIMREMKNMSALDSTSDI